MVAACLGALNPLQSQVNLEDGLVAYYPFDDGATDASGNGLDGDIHRVNKERDVNGYRKGSYRWSNDKDHIKIPVDINVGTMPQITMCAWVYPLKIYDEIIVLSNDDRGGDRKIHTVKKDRRYVWAISDGKGGSIGEVPVERKKWAFVAAVYNEDSRYASIYVNGTKTLGKTSMDMGASYTMIGANPYDNDDFEALIDEVRIYNRKLNRTELDSLMALKEPVSFHKKKKESYYYLVEQDNLLVRSRPTRNASRVGTLAKNDTLRAEETVPTVGKKYDEWLKIQHNGQNAYVSLKYLDHRTESDDDMSELEAFLDEKMNWGSWEFWAIIAGALALGILGIVFFGAIDAGLGNLTRSDYSGMAYFPIVTTICGVIFAILLVLWQDPIEYYLMENFTLWPYGYGFGTWLAWLVLAVMAVTFVITFFESIFSTNPIHALLRIIVLVGLAGLTFIPAMIITMALIIVMVVLLFLSIILSAFGGYRYVLVRY